MRRLTIRIRTVRDFRLFLRLTSLLCILTGVLSLLVIVLPAAFSPVIAPALVRSPEESLGFVFMGFAIRLSRLEQYSKAVRSVLWAARYGLLAAGILGVQGVGLLGRSDPAAANMQAPGLAVSICFVLIGGALLTSSGRLTWSIRVVALLSLLGTFVASCWISMFLVAAGLIRWLPLFEIAILPLTLISLVTICFAHSTATPGLLEMLVTDSPAAKAARQTFPAAVGLPVLLAILRHWAETSGYLHPNLGVLVHVLMSAGVMAALAGWNIYRLGMGNKLREAAETAAQERELQYRALLGAIAEPVWIFEGNGTITFSNAPARVFTPEPPDGDGASILDVLGKRQYQAIVSSAFFARQVPEVTVLDVKQGAEETRPICLVRVLKSRSLPASSLLLVLAPTGVGGHPESAGLLDLAESLKNETLLPVEE